MVNLSIFYWFVTQSAPLWQEIPILQINLCRTNQVIAEKLVIIIRIYKQHWATREQSLEVVMFVELGVWFVQDIVLSFVECFVPAAQDQIGI